MLKNIQKSIILILFLSIFVIGVTLRINNLGNVTKRSTDENIYTAQAKVLVLEGAAGLKTLIEVFNSTSSAWIRPPPTRIGYLWLLASAMKITNDESVNTGAYISTVFSILSLLFLIVIGLRFFNQWIALTALLFMSVSPMELAIARRTWQDAILGCLGLTLIYFCCEITRNINKIIWYILFFALGSYCILIKESGIIIYGLCIFWILWIYVEQKHFLRGAFLVLIGVIGASISILILINNARDLTSVLTVFKHVKEGMPTNTYVVEYQSGPWYYLLEGFWILSPANVILCAVGILGTVLPSSTLQKITSAPNSKNKSTILGIIFFITTFMFIIIITPYCQNLRFVSPLFAPFYLLSSLGLWYIVSFAKFILKKRYFYIIIASTLMVTTFIAVSEYQNFRKIFIEGATLDLSPKLMKLAPK